MEILSNVAQELMKDYMIYSNFVRLEGIGILRLVLEANGFAQFKITHNGYWMIDESEDADKPKFILYR